MGYGLPDGCSQEDFDRAWNELGPDPEAEDEGVETVVESFDEFVERLKQRESLPETSFDQFWWGHFRSETNGLRQELYQ